MSGVKANVGRLYGIDWLRGRLGSNKVIWLKNGFGLFVTLIAMLGAYWLDGEEGDGRWYSLFPPLLAIVMAFFTQRLLLSLGSAIVLGSALIHMVPNGLAGSGDGLRYIIATPLEALVDPTNLQILAFVLLVLALITVLIFSGGLQAIVSRLQQRVRGPRSAQVMTTLLGFIIFIDDYANTMIVGSTMRHLTDRYRISREKLAFLVDATSAPVAGIAVVSTWIGYEVGLFADISSKLGMNRDGYSIFFDVMGYRFYCLMMILFVIYNAWSGRDFGPMAAAQVRAQSTGDLLRPSATPMTSKQWSVITPSPHAQEKVVSALAPLVTLVTAVFVGLWWDGGGPTYGLGGLFQYSAWSAILSGAQNGPLVLAGSALCAGVLAMFLAVSAAKLPVTQTMSAWFRGMRSSLLPVIVLLLAWSLKRVCDDLHTGEFIAHVVQGKVSGLWFPALVFLVACITAFATGTSWGTMAILLPTLVPVAYALDGQVYGQVTALVCAAILDGAIMGDHCSPISDTTIMSSIASSCDHMDHVRTQMPYSLLVAALAVLLGYIPAALGWPSWLSLLGAAIAVITYKQVLGRPVFSLGSR